jgi:hypothetical protein
MSHCGQPCPCFADLFVEPDKVLVRIARMLAETPAEFERMARWLVSPLCLRYVVGEEWSTEQLRMVPVFAPDMPQGEDLVNQARSILREALDSLRNRIS